MAAPLAELPAMAPVDQKPVVRHDHFVRMIAAEDGQTIYMDSTTPGDARELARELEKATGLKWSVMRIPTTGSRFKHEHSINRSLAYSGVRKARAAAA